MGDPFDKQAFFPICSLSKAFTATLCLILHEEGVLDIEAPLNNKGVVLPLADKAAEEGLTIKDILQHRTGLLANDLLWLLSGYDTDALYNASAFLQSVPGGFGKSFNYNNLAYTFLKPILEEKTGVAFEELMTSRIFKPLQMHNTVFSFTENIADDFVLPANNDGSFSYRDVSHISPAGGIISTLEDMAKWLRFLVGDESDSHRTLLLSAESGKKLFANLIPIEETSLPLFLKDWEWACSECAYGLGFFSGKVSDKRVFFHPGIIDGYSTGIALIPELDAGVFVMINQTNSEVPSKLIRESFSILFGQELKLPALGCRPELEHGGDVDTELSSQSGAAGYSVPETLTGIYTNPAYGAVEIKAENAAVWICYFDHRWPLIMQGHNSAEFSISVCGLEIPMPVFIETDRILKIPLSLDPRVEPLLFQKI